jgi:hypothetical protein
MTPQEMHVQIDQALQRVGSYVYDNFEPVEIDLVLSKMQLRFIDDKFRKDRGSEGFQVEQGDLDDIQFLIEYDKKLTAFIDTEHRKTESILPSDYLYLVNDRSRINADCKIEDLESTVAYQDEHTVVLPFTDTTKVDAPYYEDLILDVGVTTIFDYSSFPNSVGIYDKIEKHILKQLVLDTVNQDIRENILSGITGIYWEHYRNRYEPNSFIIITDNTRAGESASLTVDSDIYTVPLVQTSDLVVSSLTYTDTVDNRFTKSQFLHSTLNNNVYHRTNKRNPVSNISKNVLSVYYDKRYIPTNILIDYIRKPREISLSLNQSCELNENTHPRIIDLAVEYFKNTIEQQGYEYKVKDNMLRSE